MANPWCWRSNATALQPERIVRRGMNSTGRLQRTSLSRIRAERRYYMERRYSRDSRNSCFLLRVLFPPSVLIPNEIEVQISEDVPSYLSIIEFSCAFAQNGAVSSTIPGAAKSHLDYHPGGRKTVAGAT